MFPQPKKWPAVLAGVVLVIVVYHNPEGAADVVNGAVSAITRFASSLHFGL